MGHARSHGRYLDGILETRAALRGAALGEGAPPGRGTEAGGRALGELRGSAGVLGGTGRPAELGDGPGRLAPLGFGLAPLGFGLGGVGATQGEEEEQ